MTDGPQSFDLKITPDWLKESPAKNPYANFEGGESAREERRGKPMGGRGPRPGGPGRPDRGDRRDKRGPDSGRRAGPPRGERRFEGRPSGQAAPAPQPPPEPAPVAVEFLPEPGFVEVLAKQLKAAGHAYPLLEIARMFMAEPERQRIRLHVSKEGVELFQCGENGPVALDRSQLVADGFQAQFAKLYTKEVIQKEEIRGNFTNVARCRPTGTLLGPTNHHTYQAALRRLYEERFSRRMDFDEFLRSIEIVTDPAVVEQWKEQARSVTVIKTLDEAEPRSFESEAEALRDFRERHFDKLVTSGKAFEISGTTSRALADRALFIAIRNAWEEQRLFPAQMIFHIRRVCVTNGLHAFRREKNMQYVCSVRPRRFKGDASLLAESAANILRAVEGKPRCTRHELAARLLPQEPAHPDLPKLKEQLAGDLHWLIQAGHIVEYHDGRLEIAPEFTDQKPAREKSAPQRGKQRPAPATPAEPPTAAEAESTPAPAPAASETPSVPEPAVETAAESVSESTAGPAAEPDAATSAEPAADLSRPD